MMNRPRAQEPTLRVPKFVGIVLTSEWVAQVLLAYLTTLLSTDLNFKDVPRKGNLSDWIKRLQKGPFTVGAVRISLWKAPTYLWHCLELLCALRDPVKRNEIVHQLKKHVSSKDLDYMQACLSNRDFREFDDRWKQIGRKAGLRSRFDILEVLWLLRAAQTGFRCIAHKTNPLVLINRACQGDRQAVLDLVKVDKLFLIDTCTQEVISKAILENDRRFIEQLARAENYKPVFTHRDACQIYLYILFLLRIKLPTIYKLRGVLDPEGTEFRGNYGFEKFVERRRNEIQPLQVARPG